MAELMLKTVVVPIRSEALYQGFYSDFAFESLGNPIPFYRSILKHLGQFGVNLSTLSTNLASLPDASVTCYLSDLGIFLSFRLDRFDITVQRLHEITADVAEVFVRAAWKAVSDTDKSLAIARHSVSATIHAELGNNSYNALLSEFIHLPENFGANAQAGAVFYTNENGLDGSIVLDRVSGMSNGMMVKLSLVFDGQQHSIENIINQSAQYLDQQLARLNLQLGK